MYRSELTKLELYQEDGKYFLNAEYEEEDNHRLQRYTIPKILLPIDPYPTIRYDDRTNSVDLGFGELPVLECDKGYLFELETVKEYPQKMTLEEIEKKLGYKVEIVSGK